jgi:hypothetical protein
MALRYRRSEAFNELTIPGCEADSLTNRLRVGYLTANYATPLLVVTVAPPGRKAAGSGAGGGRLRPLGVLLWPHVTGVALMSGGVVRQ